MDLLLLFFIQFLQCTSLLWIYFLLLTYPINFQTYITKLKVFLLDISHRHSEIIDLPHRSKHPN
ncbi:Uncharacterised protein [Yersinia bercovieri]|nr:Uncharacterised protein [Yersinia bercovieri]